MGVGVAVVVVEDEDGQHHAASHHPLDEVEVGPCNVAMLSIRAGNIDS